MQKIKIMLILCISSCFIISCGAGWPLSATGPSGNTKVGTSSLAGVALFNKGLYSQAYAALLPYANGRDPEPEAVFYVLIIKRNGLDGQAYNFSEVQGLWSLLSQSAATMRTRLNEHTITIPTAMAYRTALAQLEYFGVQHPSVWPPPLMPDKKKELHSARLGLMVPVERLFKPALNFSAYLWLAPDQPHQLQAFKNSVIAANDGDHLAMCNLAWLFREGIGGEKNNLRAARWARAAAESTPPVARCLNEVGFAYEAAIGVTQDLGEARRWYEKSAAQGHQAGQINFNRLQNKDSSAAVLDNSIMF